VDDQVGTPGPVVEAHLLAEVAPVHQPGQLDRAPQVQLAPPAAHLRLAQRGRQRPGLALELVDLGVEVALPGGAGPVEVVHLVAEPVEALHHLGLVQQPLDVRAPGARPQHAEQGPEGEPEGQGEEERHRGHVPSMAAATDNPTEARPRPSRHQEWS